MKSITIHGLNDALDHRIRTVASKEGQSLNKTIKRLLMAALGMGERPMDRRGDFEDLFGSWSKADLEAFERATDSLNQVDPKDWE